MLKNRYKFILRYSMKKVEDERVERIIKSSKRWDNWPKPNISFFDVFPLLADPSIL